MFLITLFTCYSLCIGQVANDTLTLDSLLLHIENSYSNKLLISQNNEELLASDKINLLDFSSLSAQTQTDYTTPISPRIAGSFGAQISFDYSRSQLNAIQQTRYQQNQLTYTSHLHAVKKSACEKFVRYLYLDSIISMGKATLQSSSPFPNFTDNKELSSLLSEKDRLFFTLDRNRIEQIVQDAELEKDMIRNNLMELIESRGKGIVLKGALDKENNDTDVLISDLSADSEIELIKAEKSLSLLKVKRDFTGYFLPRLEFGTHIVPYGEYYLLSNSVSGEFLENSVLYAQLSYPLKNLWAITDRIHMADELKNRLGLLDSLIGVKSELKEIQKLSLQKTIADMKKRYSQLAESLKALDLLCGNINGKESRGMMDYRTRSECNQRMFDLSQNLIYTLYIIRLDETYLHYEFF